MSSAGKSALEYLKSIHASPSPDDIPDTNIWLTAVPGDAARDRGMTSGADQRCVETDHDVIEFVAEWYGKRNLYYKATRFDPDAPGPRIAEARVFRFAWIDIDLASKPNIADAKLIDMACDALDKLKHPPSVIVATGGGVQALWHFDVPLIVGTTIVVDGVDVQAHTVVENINRELARIFAGDTAVCHPAGGLRLPFTVNVNRAGSVARTLRVEPDKTCKAVALFADLRTLGVALAKTKDGSWSMVTGALSKAANVHATAGRQGLPAGGEHPAKSPEEWEEVIDAMVVKGGRDVATTSYAGKLVRAGLSDDECYENIMGRIGEASARVRAVGGQPAPLGRSTVMAKIRSVRKKHERSQPVSSGSRDPGPVKGEKHAPVESMGARILVPPDETPMSMDKLDTGFDLDPGNFFAPGGQVDPPGESDDLDPKDYDPSREPATVAELRWCVKLWREKTNKKGERVNANKEYPYSAPNLIVTSTAIWLRTLDKAKGGVLWDSAASQWWSYLPDAGVWDRVAFDTVDAMLSTFLVRVLGHAGKAKVRREFLQTIAPGLAPAGGVTWDLPMKVRQHVALAGCGTLVLIDPTGALMVRAAAKGDMLTAEGCPRIAAHWVPGAACPTIEGALDVVLGHLPATERAAQIETYWSWASQILLTGDRPKATYRAMIVHGERDTGKSVMLDVVRAVLDGMPGAAARSAVCPMSLADFDGAFGRAWMLGKRAWLVHETSTGYRLQNEDVFKQIVVNEAVTVNVKHQAAQQLKLGVTIGIATNNPPEWRDVSEGTMSRLVYFNTLTKFVPAKAFNPVTADLVKPRTRPANVNLFAEMVPEGAGALQKMAVAACALVRAGAMPVSAAMLADTEAEYGAEDTVLAFVEQGVEAVASGKWCPNAQIWRAYRGMLEREEGPASAARGNTLAARRRLFTKLRLKFNVRTSSARQGAEVLRVTTGVWLTPQAVVWLMYGLRHDDKQTSKPLSDYRLEAERANGPVALQAGAAPVTNVLPFDAGQRKDE